MKKTILLAVAFGFIAAGTVQAFDDPNGSHGVAPGSGISGSKHDLSTYTGLSANYENAGDMDPLDRICIWCHAPHHTYVTSEAAGVLYLPLWNHKVTSKVYQMYESDFGDGPDGTGMAIGSGGGNEQFADRHVLNADLTGQPGGVSRLCLSCHDGTVAVNEYGRDPQRDYSRSSGGSMITNVADSGGAGQFLIGGNPYGLLNHHPIGFVYQDVVDLDDEIADVSTPIAGSGTPEMTTIGSLLYSTKMECVTCHDVHNSKNTGETFLWVTDEHSGFCLTCHLK